MEIFEFSCQKCRTFVELDKLPMDCPSCGSRKMSLLSYDKARMGRFLIRLTELEKRIARLEIRERDEDLETTH